MAPALPARAGRAWQYGKSMLPLYPLAKLRVLGKHDTVDGRRQGQCAAKLAGCEAGQGEALLPLPGLGRRLCRSGAGGLQA